MEVLVLLATSQIIAIEPDNFTWGSCECWPLFVICECDSAPNLSPEGTPLYLDHKGVTQAQRLAMATTDRASFVVLPTTTTPPGELALPDQSRGQERVAFEAWRQARYQTLRLQGPVDRLRARAKAARGKTKARLLESARSLEGAKAAELSEALAAENAAFSALTTLRGVRGSLRRNNR